MSEIPKDLLYTETHEWVAIEDGIATCGITDFAQDQLGDIVYVELPEAGSAVVAGEVCGVIESVKAASDLYAPVSGEVVEVNQDLTDAPELINKDPYGDGWLFRVKMSDPSETDALLDAARYEQFVVEES